MKNKFPLSRVEDIVVQELKDEILVCDIKENQVFCLNETAGEVWKMCDGKTSISEISQKLSKKFRADFSGEMVAYSLEKLAKLDLLVQADDYQQYFSGNSRREVIKKIGLSSMIALPLIMSVAMPHAAQAQTGCPTTNKPAGCPCSAGAACASGCCLENFPGPSICGSTFGVAGCFCTSNAQCDPAFECCAPSNPVCSPGC